MVVLAVGAQVLGELVDPLGEQRDLDLGLAGVGRRCRRTWSISSCLRSWVRVMRPVRLAERRAAHRRTDRARRARRRSCICSISASTESKRRSPRSRARNSTAALAVEVDVAVEQVGLDQHRPARAEGRAHADADRRAGAVGARGVDAVAGADELLVGDEVGGREAERAARAGRRARPRRAAGTARRASARRWLHLAGQHERADVAGGDDLAVDLDERARRGSRSAGRRPAAPVSPAAPWPKRKFSPTETWVARSRPTSTCVDELLRRSGAAKPSSNGITTSSCTPSSAISSALASRLVSSFGAASGRITAQRVGLEGQHRVVAGDHLAVAEVDAVELADGHPARARLRRRRAS